MASDRAMVVGYQPTSEGEDAVALGRQLATPLDMRAAVATVLPWTGAWFGESGYDEMLRDRLAEPLSRACRSFEGGLAEAHFEVASSPALGLRRTAVAHRAGLLVIGSTHHGAIGHALLGSTGDSLLAGAPCAVAVAPTGHASAARPRPRHVGVAFDGSPEAHSALGAGIDIAERAGARLTLVGVMEFVHCAYANGWTALPTVDPRDLERDAKQEILDRGLASVPERVRARTELVGGPVGEALSEVSDDFDLLLAGSRGYGPPRRATAGSSTHKLLRGARCPVLITPRGAAVDPLPFDDAETGGERSPAAVGVELAATPTGA